MNKERINVDPRKYVWKVQHGNPKNPDGVIYVDCVGKATAKLTAAKLGYKRMFVATPHLRSEIPSDASVYGRIV